MCSREVNVCLIGSACCQIMAVKISRTLPFIRPSTSPTYNVFLLCILLSILSIHCQFNIKNECFTFNLILSNTSETMTNDVLTVMIPCLSPWALFQTPNIRTCVAACACVMLALMRCVGATPTTYECRNLAFKLICNLYSSAQ